MREDSFRTRLITETYLELNYFDDFNSLACDNYLLERSCVSFGKRKPCRFQRYRVEILASGEWDSERMNRFLDFSFLDFSLSLSFIRENIAMVDKRYALSRQRVIEE